MTTPVSPVTVPGEILNWPMLKISYLTDPANIAALLPPGISPGKSPKVTITIYNFPVLNEPEYGCVVNVDAIYNGIEGEYTLGIGIDRKPQFLVAMSAGGSRNFTLKPNISALWIRFLPASPTAVTRSWNTTERSAAWVKSPLSLKPMSGG